MKPRKSVVLLFVIYFVVAAIYGALDAPRYDFEHITIWVMGYAFVTVMKAFVSVGPKFVLLSLLRHLAPTAGQIEVRTSKHVIGYSGGITSAC